MATGKPSDSGKSGPGHNGTVRFPQPANDSVRRPGSQANRDTTVARMQPRRDGSSGGKGSQGK